MQIKSFPCISKVPDAYKKFPMHIKSFRCMSKVSDAYQKFPMRSISFWHRAKLLMQIKSFRVNTVYVNCSQTFSKLAMLRLRNALLQSKIFRCRTTVSARNKLVTWLKHLDGCPRSWRSPGAASGFLTNIIWHEISWKKYKNFINRFEINMLSPLPSLIIWLDTLVRFPIHKHSWINCILLLHCRTC